MSKPKIMSITYSEELPEESAIILYRVIEKLVIDSLPTEPSMIGLFLKDSLDEFNKNGKEISNAKQDTKRNY
ncbi:hypothetical protein J7I80_21315 [Bacillus sp. ISL-41]|uniref:hypothetical protein n=1 Tax=Bacillus sp. ISL-41 TaxID=2819127 RepID=UPI001BE6C3F8|nr:hypothetical protein [Bacillus sp. ISL-41]MBT2644762.1 hypothetical protein [Bacillus sp. ISL-41]